MGGLYWLSSIPGEVDPNAPLLSSIVAWTPPALQNLLHIPVFGILAWLWHRTLRAWIHTPRRLIAWTLALSAGYGVLDELHQLQVPGRFASLTDMVLNILGTGIALWLIKRANPKEQTASLRNYPICWAGCL
jgi:glycopeptide antibiotics resistance protein